MFCLCFSILIQMTVIFCEDINEPVCTSRFDYDHKMLQKMLTLEMEHTKLTEKVDDQSREITNLRERLGDEATERKKAEIKIQRIERVASFESTGVTYIRWGRTSCPGNGTSLVYMGYAGGSLYSNKGAASSYVCLPEEPVWGVYEDAEQSGASVWGAEYELDDRKTASFFGKELHNRDVPCCVCHSKRQTVLMIPGRNVCYEGWTLEYDGYLTAGHDTHNGGDFACLDKEAEVLSGGLDSQNGKLFYFAESRCGSLRCPPYVNGRELTCVLCTI